MSRTRLPRLALLVALLLSLPPAPAGALGEDERYVPESDPLVLANLERWQDLKLGLLMHWGPYSQWGIVESWSICAEDEVWCARPDENYVEYKRRYEGLQRTFNPTRFDPGRWARAARAAGMRYVVFTTKHHDGFCMFDTRTTDYRVTSPDTPFHADPRADVTLEVFDAFRRENLWVGAYFSKPDWHSELYWWPRFATPDRNVNYDPAAHPERWAAFVEYTHAQVLELMRGYGRIDILWLDGGWVRRRPRAEIEADYRERSAASATGFVKARAVDQDIRMDDLVAKARALQPGLIVVDRAVHGKHQNYLTPENRVPATVLPYPWETCMVSAESWSYKPGERYMSGLDAVHLLVDVVAKGGNLLLNVGPGPDGEWAQGAYDLLAELGSWLDVNGAAIYGSRPLAPHVDGALRMTRQRDGSAYFIVLSGDEAVMPEEIRVGSHRPAADAEVTLLGATGTLSWRPDGERGFIVALPPAQRAAPPCRHAWTLRVSKLS